LKIFCSKKLNSVSFSFVRSYLLAVFRPRKFNSVSFSFVKSKFWYFQFIKITLKPKLNHLLYSQISKINYSFHNLFKITFFSNHTNSTEITHVFSSSRNFHPPIKIRKIKDWKAKNLRAPKTQRKFSTTLCFRCKSRALRVKMNSWTQKENEIPAIWMKTLVFVFNRERKCREQVINSQL
jgi:hypothetical protein